MVDNKYPTYHLNLTTFNSERYFRKK